MRFSIITVTKNNKSGLLRAIECVRDQTYKNVEHIIVDGGSTDGTAEILKQVQDDIRSAQNDSLLTTHLPTGQAGYSLLTISEADSGIYDAINKGIKLATGDVIGLLHSDDLYADENVLEKYASAFNQPTTNNKPAYRPGRLLTIDAVYSDLVYVSKMREVGSEKLEADSGSRQRRAVSSGTTNQSANYSLLTCLPDRQATNYSVIRYWRSHTKSVDSGSRQRRAGSSGMTTSGYQSLITDNRLLVTDHLLKKGWMPPHPTLFIRKEIFEKYGYYRTDMKIAADYEMILRLLYKYKITSYYLPLTTYLMSIGGVSNKSLKNILQKSKEDYQAMKLNEINFPILTLISKNLRKLPQFLARD